MALFCVIFRSENKQGLYVFDIPTVANDMGVSAVELTNQLYDLKVWISGYILFLEFACEHVLKKCMRGLLSSE